jgi:nitrite transporter NirC
MINKFFRAIAAGVMIGIAGAVYLAVGPPLGAILFSLGLILICARGYNLYTGKIGYIQKPKEAIDMWIYVGGNALGTWLVATTQTISTTDLITAKLAMPWWLTLIKAIGCGILMYLAVDIYKQGYRVYEQVSRYIGIIVCIPAFILAGFEHSIADMFYIWLGGIYDWRVLEFICIVILGNAIGANLHHLDKLKKI